MFEPNGLRARPETIAGFVNALVVLLLPLGFLLFGDLIFDGVTNTSTTVRAVDPSGVTRARALTQLLRMALMLFPFAVVAGWRTWHHARRWREPDFHTWRGVLEAGACGLMVALGVLSPGILMKPSQAAPFVLFYGTAASILGLVVGLFLRMTALLVLRFVTSPTRPTRA